MCYLSKDKTHPKMVKPYDDDSHYGDPPWGLHMHVRLHRLQPTAKQGFSVKLPLLSSPTSTSDEQDKGM